jgi:beta-mannanase
VFVRFGHEMNGSWYAWGQRPEAFIASFRAVADAVHNYAPRSTVVWAPNYGGGYPFIGGSHNAKSGTADFAALDTNRDGVLNMRDDPYAPYYPGDGYVDWVALTLYHYGNAWPWGENEIPEPDKFSQNVTGTYNGLGGDERILPDFYAEYAVGHGKPFAIAETSAFYNPTRTGTGVDDYDIKSHWWAQLYARTIPLQFPKLKMVLWFEHKKEEMGRSTVDWTVTYDPDLLRGFRASLPPWLIFAEDQRRIGE